MTTFIRKSLERKREMLENGEKGFTLIELLIVVLIIGVLAAIAIPIYLTTQDTAKDNAVKTAVTEAKTALVAQYTVDAAFPATIDAIDEYSQTGDVTVAFVGTGNDIDDFCIMGTYAGDTAGTKTWYITDEGAPSKTACT